METVTKREKTSTSKRIVGLGLPTRQRNRALADLAVADAVVGMIIAASKLFDRR